MQAGKKTDLMSAQTVSPHLPLLVLGEQSAVEIFQRQLGHGHSLSGVVAHGKGSCSPSRHGHTILQGNKDNEEQRSDHVHAAGPLMCENYLYYVVTAYVNSSAKDMDRHVQP